MRVLTAGLAMVLAAGPAVPATASAKDAVGHVDPLIGSAGGGNTYPGAAGDVPIMPFVGEVTGSPTADVRDEVHAADFSHADESATPGRCAVEPASGASVDLSVTTRAGVGDFTFPRDRPAALLFRVSNSLNGSEDAEVTIDPATRTPWLYMALGQPWKTQETVRAMASLVYRTGPSGLSGNDDLGTMSAWYVFAALGVYPQTPSRAELLLSSPMFVKAKINRSGGPKITISAPEASPSNVYVGGVTVNGRAHDRSWLPEEFVARGGELVVDVAAVPDTPWGVGELPVDHG